MRRDGGGPFVKLYIMISRTDTFVGSLIRLFSGYHYNHISMTLDPDLKTWVSFARYHRTVPLFGGFIRETGERFLSKGQPIDVRIFALDLTGDQYDKLSQVFALAGTGSKNLRYNLFALVTASVSLDLPISGAYTCLGFANRILGTDHRRFQTLDAQLQDHLFYEGPLSGLIQDSGQRQDPYFTPIPFWQALWLSLGAIGGLLRAMALPQPDPILTILEKEGVTP